MIFPKIYILSILFCLILYPTSPHHTTKIPLSLSSRVLIPSSSRFNIHLPLSTPPPPPFPRFSPSVVQPSLNPSHILPQPCPFSFPILPYPLISTNYPPHHHPPKNAPTSNYAKKILTSFHHFFREAKNSGMGYGGEISTCRYHFSVDDSISSNPQTSEYSTKSISHSIRRHHLTHHPSISQSPRPFPLPPTHH